jgi:hypothetical protein
VLCIRRLGPHASWIALALIAVLAAAVARAQEDAGVAGAVPSWRPAPWSRDLADQPRMLSSAERCLSIVRATRARDLVHPQRAQIVVADPMDGVELPARLTSTLMGVVIGAHGGHRRPRPMIGDCRSFAALAAWSRVLHDASIVRVGHSSFYRTDPRVDRRHDPSGHARALAIDLAHFVFEDGTDFDVGRDWADRTRGASPCGDRAAEDAHMTAVRRVVCAASDASYFNVVLTPHYDDDHQSHVHLEVRPGMTGLVLH